MAIPDGYNGTNPLGQNTADNEFDSPLVVANADGSVLERLEYLQGISSVGDLSKTSPNYLAVPITFAALTTGAIGTHELFTVTGCVRVKLMAVCTTNVAGGGTIELGFEDDTDNLISTTTGTDIDAGELWIDASPTEKYANQSSVIFDKIIANGSDIGYEIKTDTLTSGVIKFYLWWDAISSDGAVVAADGTGAL